MGIVAYCPGGHRVKVKDHLAGRKGICPTCGARFRIPLASASAPGAGSGLPVAAVVSFDAGLAATLPPALELATPQRPAAREQAAVGHVPNRDDDEIEIESAVDDEPPTTAWPAAIVEAAGASWCVAVPGGEASPPMTGHVMREWLASGRATGAELVWRSDWSDWRPIRLVFPDQAPSQPPGGDSGRR
jgi:hypothetical protein